ncbi:MAG: hypothetical protein V1865_01155 [bacterium]
MAYIDAFVPVEEEEDIERQLADQKSQDKAKANKSLSKTSVNPMGRLTGSEGSETENESEDKGKRSKVRRSGGGGKIRKGAGTGIQAAGAGAQVASKAIEMTGKGMQVAGKGAQKGGKAMIRAGAKLSTSGVGAIAGVPLMIAGGAAIGAGAGAQGLGKGMEVGGRSAGKASKKVKDKGRNIKRKGGIGGSSKLNIPGMGGKTDKGDGFNLVGAAASAANRAVGGTPLTRGLVGSALMAAINMFKKVVGFGSKNILRFAWVLVPFTLGLSLIYIVFHGIASHFVGRRMFCRLGEEWGVTKALTAPSSVISKSIGGTASMAGAGSIGNIISAAPRAGIEMSEWMIVAILVCLAAGFWLVLFVIFTAVAEGIVSAINFISSAYNYIANNFAKLFGI